MKNTDKVNPDELKRFESEFQGVKDVIPEILRLKKEYEERKIQINVLNNYAETLTDNQLVTLYTIYYCGRDYKRQPIDGVSIKNDYLKECVLTMDALNLSYDKGINRMECLRFLNNKWRWINDFLTLALNILK